MEVRKTSPLIAYVIVLLTSASSHVICSNGAGPGCSSLGFGAMLELGPFRVNNDNKTLSRNMHAWNEGNL